MVKWGGVNKHRCVYRAGRNAGWQNKHKKIPTKWLGKGEETHCTKIPTGRKAESKTRDFGKKGGKKCLPGEEKDC